MRRTSSRPLVEPEHNSHLLHTGRSNKTVTKNGKKRVLVRQTFEGLVQLGFDLASKDFVLIDPLNEAALKRFHDYFRPEEEAS